MERCFIATKESKWIKDYNSYIEDTKQQRKFADKFSKEKGIDGQHYQIGGNGGINRPFGEYEKDRIILSIESTESNLNKFGKMLNKPNEYNMCKFRKNSSINKEFQQRCVDEKIIINLYEPDIRDYFQSLHWTRTGYQAFPYKNNWYVKIESENLKEDDTPEGFEEIKLSEYYRIKEIRESEKKEKQI